MGYNNGCYRARLQRFYETELYGSLPNLRILYDLNSKKGKSFDFTDQKITMDTNPTILLNPPLWLKNQFKTFVFSVQPSYALWLKNPVQKIKVSTIPALSGSPKLQNLPIPQNLPAPLDSFFGFL